MANPYHLSSDAPVFGRLRQRKHVSVLFVCLGNICRSPAAEGIMQSIVDEHDAEARWTVDSAGIGGWHVGDLPDSRMRLHGRRRGYNFVHRCRQVRPSDFDNFDLIIGMDNNNIAELRRLAPTPQDEEKILRMAAFLPQSCALDYVPDPYYEGADGYELVLDRLQDACHNLYNCLTPKA